MSDKKDQPFGDSDDALAGFEFESSSSLAKDDEATTTFETEGAKQARLEVEAQAKAEAEAKQAEIEAAAKAEQRLELFYKLDKLMITIHNKSTEGNLDLLNAPFEERVARARVLSAELEPLIAEVEALADYTPTEQELLNASKSALTSLKETIDALKSRVESQPTMAQVSTPPPEPSHGAGAVAMPPPPPPGAMNASAPSVPPPLPPKAEAKPRVSEPSVIISDDIDEEDGLPALEEEMSSVEGLLKVMKVGSAPKPENDYVINHPSVSRHHAKLTLLSDGNLLVEDLKSTNGTFVVTEKGNHRVGTAKIPVVVAVGAILRFGSVEMFLDKRADNNIYLEFSETQPTGHTTAFEARSEEVSRKNAEEQAALDAQVDQAHEEVIDSLETSVREGQRSTTEIQREVAAGGSPRSGWIAVIGGALAVIAIAVFFIGGGIWIYDHQPVSDPLATTLPTEVPTVTPTEVPTDSTTIPETTPSSSYNCHSVTADASCHAVASFLLTRGTGSPYWDCAGLNPDQARGIFHVEDPEAEHRHILADTCACQLCEPL